MIAPQIHDLTVSEAEPSDAGGGTTTVVAPGVAGKRVVVMGLHIAKGSLDVGLLVEFGTTMQIASTAYKAGVMHLYGALHIRKPLIGPPGEALRVTATSSSALHAGYYMLKWFYL